MIISNEKINYGGRWSGLVLFTANATIRRDSALVMGAGAALQVNRAWPDTPYRFGRLIKFFGQQYGVIQLLLHQDQRIGAFQVKDHWQDHASLNLIAYATEQLRHIAVQEYPRPIHCNYPGIGYGGLLPEHVDPIIECLPDNVIFHQRRS